MFVKYKWLSPDGDAAGADTSGTDAAQGNSGAGGQSTPNPEIKRLHDEAATWRNKHKDAVAEAARLKTELEAEQGKRAASETQTSVEKALFRAAAKANFNDPEDALKYVDVAAIMKLDADKREAAISEALGKLATDRAYLVRGTATQGTDGKKPGASPANPADNKPSLTLEQIKGMSREELAARKDEVFRVLKASGGS